MEKLIRGSLKGVIPDGRWVDMEKSWHYHDLLELFCFGNLKSI